VQKGASLILDRLIYNASAYLQNDILPNPREDVRLPITKCPRWVAAMRRLITMCLIPSMSPQFLRVAPGSCPECPRQAIVRLCPRECSASATDAANLAINAGVFLVEAQQSIPGRYGRGNIGDARLVVTDWRGPDR
jgi:hypothetical protein